MTHPNPEIHALRAIWPWLTTADTGRLLERNERTVRRWLSGQYPLDSETAAWLARLLAFLRTNPAP